MGINKKEKKGTPYEKLVAIVVSAFHPNCEVKQGQWVDGPDGRRDMDVVIEGLINNKHKKILIECKDYDKMKTGKVGISIIDALDSKRKDLNIDVCFICSNSGFTADALRKAKRVGVGAISVLRKGDDRVKINIIEKIYYQVITIISITCKFNFHEKSIKHIKELNALNLFYKGLPVYKWLQNKIITSNVLSKNLTELKGEFSFKHPIEVKYIKLKLLLLSVEGTVKVSRDWYSSNVQLDAESAIYDYLTGQLMLSSGKNTLSFNGLNILSDEKTIELNPPDSVDLGFSFNNEKNKIVFELYEKVGYKSNSELPNLDPYVL